MEYISSLFAGGFSLPYDIGEKYAESWGQWEHFKATRTADKKPFSLFRLTAGTSDALALEAARNCVKRLRMVCNLHG
jgi:SCY1-like protein 1